MVLIANGDIISNEKKLSKIVLSIAIFLCIDSDKVFITNVDYNEDLLQKITSQWEIPILLYI